jgi:hypothetical protein
MEDQNEGVDSFSTAGAGDVNGSGSLGREGKHKLAGGNMAALEGWVGLEKQPCET